MKQTLKLGWVGLFVWLVACSPQEKPAEVAVGLDSVMAAYPDFSGVVLVAQRGQPVYVKSFGYRDFETQALLDTASVFELASVSKAFTAMIIMMLEEEGRLSYEDSVGKFIPALPYRGVSIRHLLNHTSGLPDYQAVMDQHWDKSQVASNEDNIAYLIQYHPEKNFNPGEKYEYSNTGYMLLASIAEKASGQDFLQLLQDRIFSPLRMSMTRVRTKTEKDKLPNMAWGHIWVEERGTFVKADSFPAFNYTIWLGNRKGPGRISSTARDMLRWDRALYGTQLVSEETLTEAFTPAKLNDGTSSFYGFGWDLEQDSTLGKVVRHSGDNPGYKTHFIRFLDRDYTVIVLCNNAHDKFDEIVNRLTTQIRMK
jgi:CubicO group peptidase (beta-lactamase class C family)